MSLKRISKTFPDTAIETLTFVDKREEYPGVFTYSFHPVHPVPFTAGEYGHIRILSMPLDVRRVREFSFASAPHEDLISFGVDGRSNSDYQQQLQNLKIGDPVELFKIRSHMTWVPDTSEVVMIAGGVGVTPFLSMLCDTSVRKLPINSTLLHVAQNEFLYEEEFDTLANEYITIHRVDLEKAVFNIVSRKPKAHYYIAGSENFATAVFNQLEQRDITLIESDVFKGLHND